MDVTKNLMESRWVWKVAAVVAIMIFIVIFGRTLPLKEWFLDFSGWVDDRGPWGMVIYGAVYLVGVVLLVPGWMLTVGAGLTFGVLWGILISTVAATSGAVIAFLITRYVARGTIERYAARNKGFKAVDEAIASKGWKIIIFLRMSPAIPWNISNYLYGLTKISLRHYIIGTLIGMQPGNLLLLYLGAAGRISMTGRKEISPLQIGFLVAGFVITILVTLYVARISRRALKESNLDTLAME